MIILCKYDIVVLQSVSDICRSPIVVHFFGGASMLLKDLLVVNKNWSEDSTLVIVDRDQEEPQSLKSRFARSIYGDRNVCWFKEDVVILM